MAKPHGWKTIASEIAHENRWYRIRKDTVRRPNGTPGEYYVLVHPGSVYLIALNEENQFPLVHLFRYPTQDYSWEVPAGGAESDNFLQQARKELQEETGLTAQRDEEIAVLQSMNGVADERMHVFIARGLTQSNRNKQAEEGIDSLRWVGFSEAFTMIKNGELTDSQSVAAITQAALHLGLIDL